MIGPDDTRSCPACRSFDRVSKVSAIKGAQTATYSRTDLASRLSPGYRNTSNGGGSVALLIFALLLLAWVIFGDSPTSDIGGRLGFSSLFWIPIIGFFVYKSRQISRDEKYDNTLRTAWERLYYCGRDDIVFVPGIQGAEAPSGQMMGLLHRIM